MSLLSNPWFSAGMGLLAANGPSLSPVNPWGGLAAGLMNASNAQAQEQEMAYRQKQAMWEEQRMAAEQARQQQMQQWAMNQPDPQGAALFPEEAFKLANTAAGESVEIRTAGELGLSQYLPDTAIEVTMRDGRPTNYTPMQPDAASQDPTSFREYALGQKDPAFAAHLERMARAKASQVNIGGEKLPANYRWINPQDPAMGVEAIPGGPATLPTEGQGLASGFYDRMSAAAETIDSLEESGYDPATVAHAVVPDMLAPPETQMYRQAQRDWVRSKLRKESGASISPSEMEGEIKTFFPQPNESPKSVAQKRRARAIAERAMFKQSGPLGKVNQAAPMTPPPPPGFVPDN